MATGARSTYDATGKENFRDLLSLMKVVDTRAETPITSELATGKANGVYHEWTYFNRARPTGGHAKLEGEATTFSALTSPILAINYVESIESPFLLTREQQLAQRTGGSEMSVRKEDALRHLKAMIEFEVIWASGVSGNQSTARYMKGMLSLLSMVTNASNPTMTEANFTKYLKQIWSSTTFGKLSIFADSAIADNIDSYSSSVTKFRDQNEMRLNTFTKVVETAYGTAEVFRHRDLAGTQRLVIADTKEFKLAYYDQPHLETLGKDGNYDKMAYYVSVTLEALNPLAGIAVQYA